CAAPAKLLTQQCLLPRLAREVSLVSKKRGSAPLPIHEISEITLKVVMFHFCLSAPTYTIPPALVSSRPWCVSAMRHRRVTSPGVTSVGISRGLHTSIN
ncbi:hypothetical protein H5410_026149, partial [Solanum commersonii]